MISIVIPTYNEVKNIIPLLEKIISLIKHINYEIIVVDDDSPDGTAEMINNYMKNNIKNLENQFKSLYHEAKKL